MARQPGGYGARDRERWVAEDPAQKRADRDDFARDRARVIHSASLRRLSAKTQVVQPGSDDFARTRLTHSLEVAQIGREFGAALGCDADVVDTACLAHDLGHPPFGHNGEVALDAIARGDRRLRGQRPDAAGAHPARGQAVPTPTAARPGSTSPGPASTRPRSTHGGAARAPGRPPSSASTPTTCRSTTGSATARPRGERCLEAEVMDWADDVAYSVHDIEDAIASRSHRPAGAAQPGRRGRGLHRSPATAYAPDLAERRLRRARWSGCSPRAWCPAHTRHPRRPGGAQGHDQPPRRPVRARRRAGHPRPHGPGPSPATTPPRRPRRGARRGLGAQGGGRHFVMFADERVSVMLRQREVVAELVDGVPGRPGPARPRPPGRLRAGRRRRRRARCGSSSTRWPP